MNQQVFIDRVFALAKREGFDSWELYFEKGSSLKLSSFEKEIINYSDSTTQGVNFRGIIGGKSGSCYSEVIDEDAITMLVTKAKEAALLVESDDEVIMFEGGHTYPELKLYNEDLAGVATSEKIDLVLSQEDLAMSTGKIDKVSTSFYGDGDVACRMVNSLGLDVSYNANHAYAYLGVIASDDKDKYSAYDFALNHDFSTLKTMAYGQGAVDRVMAKMGGQQVPTGTYKVILNNEAAGDLLGVYLSVFSADAAQKGLSLLKDKEGQTIAADCITLMDDPHMEGGLSSTPFDGEGVPTYSKPLIDQGVLTTLLHNLKTAKKQGVKTTGNASRGGFKATIGVSHTNAYIAPGNMSHDDLVKEVGDGLYITELDGLHAGTNAISGDFSLGVRGFVIKEGKLDYPVKQIVVSGNFFTLLKDVEAVADDLKFTIYPVGSPSLYVKGLSVAGKSES